MAKIIYPPQFFNGLHKRQPTPEIVSCTFCNEPIGLNIRKAPSVLECPYCQARVPINIPRGEAG